MNIPQAARQNQIASPKANMLAIAADVENPQVLISGVLPGTEVVLLNDSEDGIVQISRILAAKPAQTLHLVCHGSYHQGNGQLHLGNVVLKQSNFNQYQEQLQTWGVSELVLYACEVGQDRDFIAHLSAQTGARVAAATGKVGNAALGGNWQLADRDGRILETLAFSEQTCQTYPGVLVSFSNQTTFAAGSSPNSVAVGDFNGDSRPDLAVANLNSSNVSVLLGNGSGGFGAQTTFAAGIGPVSVAVGDFNGDSRPDLAAANFRSNNVSVLLGNGSGGFSAQTTFAVGDRAPNSVAVGDFNGDSRPDLAVANHNSNTVSVLLGNGSGGFSAPTTFVAGNNPNSVVVGDFNGDSRPDLAVALFTFSGVVSVLLGNGSGGFSAQTTFATGSFSSSVVVGDFNSDSRPDLAVSNVTSNNVSVLLGTGSGGFAAQTTFATGSYSNSVVVGDFNGDRRPDLAVSNRDSNNVSVLLNTTTLPVVTIAATDPNAAEAGSDPGTFRISRTGDTTTPLDVTYTIAGSATNGTDYTPTLAGTATIPIGSSFTDVTIAPVDDAIFEGSETAILTLVDTAIYDLGVAGTETATVTIADNDAQPTVTLGLSGSPFSENGGIATVTATLSNPSTQDITVDLGFTGTAINGTDYNPSASTIAIAAGNTTGTISLTGINDTVFRGDRTAIVDIIDVTNGTESGTQQVTATLADDEAPSFSIAPTNASQTEGNTGTKAFTFTISRTSNTAGSNSVNWAVTGSGINPANAADFGTAFPTGTVSFTPGQTSKVVTVNVKGDAIAEPDEGFSVTLSNPTNNAVIATGSATGTILNDDTSLAIAADPSAVQAEGNSGGTAFTFTVTRSGNTTGSTNVNWAVTGGTTNPTNAADFVGNALPKGIVSFAAGETSKTVAVNVNGDTTFEPNENFDVTLSTPTGGATITNAKATGTIQNDDSVNLAIAPTNVVQAEGNTGNKPYTFTVTRSGDTTGTTSVKWAVAGSGANPANVADFGTTLPSGTLNFTAGQTSQVITVNVKGDILLESDENFTVNLSAPTPGTTLAAASATGTILNDDTVPTFAIAATNANQTEGNSGNKAFTFTVTRTGDTTGANNVNWTVSGISADSTDFGGTLASDILSFTAGQTSKVITVNVSGDAVVEPNETFLVTLSNATNGAIIGTSSATGTIINDDINVGSAGNDPLTGSAGNDTMSGLAGLDTLSGIAGNDSIDGGAGNDFLTGGLGNDTLLGGTENDTLNGVDPTSGFGQGEIDRLTGGTGSDRFILGDSNRTYYLGGGISDFALITDFGAGDVIQTHTGDVLTIGGALPAGITSGRALYLGTDLVAVVQGTIPTNASFVAV